MPVDGRERFEQAFHSVLRRGAGHRPDRVRASRPRSTPRSTSSTRSRRTSSRSRIPVEYQLPGINQLQVNAKAGLTFATGLRSMLRADPDIIMVGEIRDSETARIAHRVGAHRPPGPLHAAHQRRTLGDHRASPRWASSPSSRPRRSTAWWPSGLPGALCGHCKRRDRPHHGGARRRRLQPRAERRRWVPAYEPGGCGRCKFTGYKGRIGLYEVMTVTEDDPRDDRRARVGRAPSASWPGGRACAAARGRPRARCRPG
ncbi:MAG: ATPase, T2SS/T4P/T4SS family [Thermoleophilaceae bacterium]